MWRSAGDFEVAGVLNMAKKQALKECLELLQGNKTSATTVLPKLATTTADIACFQELNHDPEKFDALKRKLKSGKYINDDVRQRWRAEGTPSQKGPNNRNTGGTMVCTHPDVDGWQALPLHSVTARFAEVLQPKQLPGGILEGAWGGSSAQPGTKKYPKESQ